MDTIKAFSKYGAALGFLGILLLWVLGCVRHGHDPAPQQDRDQPVRFRDVCPVRGKHPEQSEWARGFVHVARRVYPRAVSGKENDKIYKQKLRQVMWDDIGIIRTTKGLHEAKNLIYDMKNKEIGRLLKLRLNTASAIVEAALARKESLGSHYIETI